MAGLEGLTRRELLGGLAGVVAALALPEKAEAKPGLEEIYEWNFEEKVYNNQRPVIVLFTEHENSYNPSHILVCQRMERVVEALAERYTSIDFYKLDADKFRRRTSLTNRERTFTQVFGIPDVGPTTVMYARHDVLTGQRFERNVKIDVSTGGPKGDQFIASWVNQYAGWIDFNLTDKHVDKPYAARWYGDNLVKVQKVSQ